MHICKSNKLETRSKLCLVIVKKQEMKVHTEVLHKTGRKTHSPRGGGSLQRSQLFLGWYPKAAFCASII